MPMIVVSSSNFREIAMGEIAPGTLYRSNHPIYNGKQVKEIILAVNKAKIQTVINLSDNIQSLRSKILYCPWYRKIFEDNRVIALNASMKFSVTEREFMDKIQDALTFMAENDPPYLLHCEAGIDRTGFLSALLESFMGASFDEMVRDYMLSFVDKNEYSGDDHRNGSIFLSNLFSKMKGELIRQTEDLQLVATGYLRYKIGIDDENLLILKWKLGNKING